MKKGQPLEMTTTFSEDTRGDMSNKSKSGKRVSKIKGKALAFKPKQTENRKTKPIVSEKARDDQAFLASIIKSSQDAILSKTLDGIITSWNDAAEIILGYSANEVIGKPISILIPPHLLNEEKLIINKVGNGETITIYETERIKKDGQIIHVSLIISPIKDSLGNIVGASKILRDITEKKKAEEKLTASEELFRHVIDNMMEGVQIHDSDWRYLYVNDALLKYSHYSREELLGYTVMEKYPGIEQTQLFKAMQRCMTQRVAEHFETEFTFPDGTKGHFEVSVQPVPQGISILSIDITKRKEAEAKINKLNEELAQKVIERTAQLASNIQHLKESEEKFQKAFHASAGGMAMIRLSDGIYVDVNNAFVQMTGYTREELIGHSSTDLGIVTDKKKLATILQEIRKLGLAKNFELAIRNKSGQHLEVLASVETILLKGERYAINLIYDITDRKKAEEQLKFANKELESFSYSVSHDLRAPLRAIHGNARILEEDYIEKFDAGGFKALQSIMRNSKRMGALIDDLLAFSKLGKKQVTVSEVNMTDLVQTTMEELLIEGIQDRTEINVNALPYAKGDQSLIKQVWINLISNAVKYSKNKPKAYIEIGGYEKDNYAVYYVKDNGVGFDMQYYDKLFGVFQRLHSTEEFEGTGIGLANVQKIVHRHNGTVWAESKPNEGACFYFSLPGINFVNRII